jgi:hypothetical protein
MVEDTGIEPVTFRLPADQDNSPDSNSSHVSLDLKQSSESTSKNTLHADQTPSNCTKMHEHTPKLQGFPTSNQQGKLHESGNSCYESLQHEVVDLVAAWPTLPVAVKAGIVAMVRASKPK